MNLDMNVLEEKKESPNSHAKSWLRGIRCVVGDPMIYLHGRYNKGFGGLRVDGLVNFVPRFADRDAFLGVGGRLDVTIPRTAKDDSVAGEGNGVED